MRFQARITQLVLTSMLLGGCSTNTQTEKPLHKTHLKPNAKTITCPDGSLVPTNTHCMIEDPIFPVCHDTSGFIVYKVNSENPTNPTFENLVSDIELSLNQSHPRWQGMWTCEPVSVEIIGHADIIFGNEADIISQRGADMVTNAVLAQGISRSNVSTEYKGAEEPFLTPKLPLLAEELNNRVEIIVDFEVTP